MGLFSKSKGLSQKEIEKALEKIRGRYRHYITAYLQDPELLAKFEDRYFSALRARIKLDNFLFAEMTAIEELIKNAQEEEAAALEAKLPKKKHTNIIENVQAKREKQISKYLPIECPGDEEIRRLFGAVSTVIETTLYPIEKHIREVHERDVERLWNRVSSEMYEYVPRTAEGVPPALEHYVSLNTRELKSYKEIELHEKQLIYSAGCFLNNAYAALTSAEKALSDQNGKAKLMQAAQAVSFVLRDFRLQDMKEAPLS
ncbi:MAG: hypothetical protein ACLFR1_05140 [Spirochaetia bacterium]